MISVGGSHYLPYRHLKLPSSPSRKGVREGGGRVEVEVVAMDVKGLGGKCAQTDQTRGRETQKQTHV